MKEGQDLDKETNINEKIKALVLARIDAQAPSSLRLFIGSSKGMNKEEIMMHVRNGDEIGKQVIKMHMNFMKAVMKGEVTQLINSV
ncbi:MAG: hypothetical protein AABX11_06095 [Nanoarchaeota archaeon]